MQLHNKQSSYVNDCYIHIITLFRRKNLKTPKLNEVPLSQGKLWTMKYYRFSRRRKNYLFGLFDHDKSSKKSDYMINTDRSKMLDSGFFENQIWVLFIRPEKICNCQKQR
jgi:hypothetical protein